MFAPLTALLNVEVHDEGTHQWCEARLPTEVRDIAAFRIALEVVSQRCGGTPWYFGAWFDRYIGGDAHPTDLLEVLEAFLGSESIGTPSNPANDVHLEGFVAEHIWHLLVAENALGFGRPLRIEGPGWSVLDSGGDGLAVYRDGGTLAFRLWESKAHTGTGEVRSVVNGACRQMDSAALRYLARYSKVGQSITDEGLQAFYGQLPELWRSAAREAGGGISVSTATVAEEHCFDNVPTYWKFTHDGDQRQGLLMVIEDYGSFSKLVREHLWKAL